MFSPRAELSTVLAKYLPELGIDECVVSEFVPGSHRAELRLVFGFNPQNLQAQNVTYPARQLVAPGFPNLERRSVLVLPLCYGAELLGIAVLPAVDGDGALYETLAETFGIVLKSMDLRRRAEARRSTSSPSTVRRPPSTSRNELTSGSTTIEHVADLAHQGFRRDGFLQERDVRVHGAEVMNGVIGVTRHADQP